MTTQEKNVLIAEFMGCEYVEKLLYNGYEGVTINGLPDELIPTYVPSQLSYHKSWDWLMPVIQKINLRDYNAKLHSIQVLINSELPYAKIEHIFEFVMQFIELFNHNKRKHASQS